MTYRIVEQTDLPNHRHVSTVFLGIDAQTLTDVLETLQPDAQPQAPRVFETMIFPDLINRRCRTFVQAVAQHCAAITFFADAPPPDELADLYGFLRSMPPSDCLGLLQFLGPLNAEELAHVADCTRCQKIQTILNKGYDLS
jgi:hypothetical protein